MASENMVIIVPEISAKLFLDMVIRTKGTHRPLMHYKETEL